jgi:hypothetical protein
MGAEHVACEEIHVSKDKWHTTSARQCQRGDVASAQHFTDSQIKKVKGRVAGTHEVRGYDIITIVGSQRDVNH